MREMEEMSNRIIFLQHGHIVAEGTSDQIIQRYGQRDLEEVFLKFAREVKSTMNLGRIGGLTLSASVSL